MINMGQNTFSQTQQALNSMMNQQYSSYFQQMPQQGVYNQYYSNNPYVYNNYNSGYVARDWRNNNLVDSVKSGQINKDEFVALAQFRNNTAKLYGRISSDGVNNQEWSYLNNRTRQYDNMYQWYKYGNYYPNTSAADNTESLQISQLGRMYAGINYGSITTGEGNYLVGEQQDISFTKGRYQYDNYIDQYEQAYLNQIQNTAERNIYNADTNWLSDNYSPYLYSQGY